MNQLGTKQDTYRERSSISFSQWHRLRTRKTGPLREVKIYHQLEGGHRRANQATYFCCARTNQMARSISARPFKGQTADGENMAASFWEADISDSRTTLSYLAFFFNESSYPKSANFWRRFPFRGFNFSWPLAGRMNGFFKIYYTQIRWNKWYEWNTVT